MSPRRVLAVAHYYPPHVGGLEAVARRAATGLAARGHDVRVLTSACPGAPGVTREQGVTVRRLRVANPFESRLGVPFPLFSPALLWHAWREVRRADVVHLHDMLYLTSWVVALCCRLTRTPYAVTMHVGMVDHPSLLVRGIQRIVHRTLGGLVLRGAARLLPISPVIADSAARLAPDTPVTVLRNGVDGDLFRPGDDRERALIRERYGLPGDRPLVLFVGRFVPKKGYDLVAASADPGHHLVFVGGDRPAGEPADPRRTHLGSRTPDEVAELYRAADLFVSASVGEGPLTPLEALRSGTPVLLNDHASHRHLLAEGPAVEFLRMDRASLARRLRELAARPERLRELRQHAVAAAAELTTWDDHVDRLRDLLHQAAEAPEQTAASARPTRVAVVAPYFAPRIGGVESYAAHQARALAADPRFDPVVITTADGLRTRCEDWEGIPVVRLGRWLVLSNTPVSPAWLWQLPRWLRRLGVDAVAAHSPVPGLADAAAFTAGRRPVQLTYHSGPLAKGGSQGPSRAVDALLGAYERLVLPRVFARARGLVAVSPVSLAARHEQAVMISPGVDVDRFRPGERRAAPPRLLYVGRLERASAWKGVTVLLEAFARVRRTVPDAELELVGSGDAVPGLREQAARLGIADAVHWTGARDGAELTAAYHRCTALVLPSLTASESFGMTLIEAMACGRAVIGSDVGGIPFVVRDGTDGLLVPPGDVAGLARAAERLLTDPGLAAELGAEGRRRAETHWAWSDRTRAMADHLHLLTSGGSP